MPKMNRSVTPLTKKIAWLFSAVYFASYVMRINFAVMLVRICSDMRLPKTALAIVLTALTVTYGAGQIISGLLGDKVNPQSLLTVGLSAAILCNVAMFFAQTPPLMAIIWGINGMAHAMLWPPIVRMLSTHLSDDEYNYSVVRVSWGSSGATLLLYLVCPLLLYVMPWRAVMLVCAAVGALILALWLAVGKRLLDAQSASEKREKRNTCEEFKPVPVPKYVYLPILLIALGIVSQGALRDGVTNWMPSYLAESFGISEESAIIAAVIPALTSIVSFSFAAYVQRKWIKNEVLCAGTVFGAAALFSGLLLLANTALQPLLAPAVSLAFSVIAMALIIGAMHCVNLMLITIVPKRFVKSGKVSTYSGILNACTYIGAALSNYGFAALAEWRGWNATVLAWLAVCAMGLALCLAATARWERFKKE